MADAKPMEDRAPALQAGETAPPKPATGKQPQSARLQWLFRKSAGDPAEQSFCDSAA